MRRLATAAVLILAASPLWAVFPDAVDRDELAALKARIEAGDPAGARAALEAMDQETPGDADVLNLLGYASRKMGEFDASRRWYERALTVDPRHLGALEYFGELELQTGDEGAARALLVRLRGACPQGCEELEDLEEAFTARGLTP